MVIHGSVMLQCPSLQTNLQQLPPAGPLVVMTGITADAETATVIGRDNATTPVESVTLTVNDPELVTLMERVVCPPGVQK